MVVIKVDKRDDLKAYSIISKYKWSEIEGVGFRLDEKPDEVLRKLGEAGIPYEKI